MVTTFRGRGRGEFTCNSVNKVRIACDMVLWELMLFFVNVKEGQMFMLRDGSNES
jgi:hypothetical protein